MSVTAVPANTANGAAVPSCTVVAADATGTKAVPTTTTAVTVTPIIEPATFRRKVSLVWREEPVGGVEENRADRMTDSLRMPARNR